MSWINYEEEGERFPFINVQARMGVVTRKGLADLIREEFGFRITFFFMMALLVTNFANIVAEFAGIAMREVFEKHEIKTDLFVSAINCEGTVRL